MLTLHAPKAQANLTYQILQSGSDVVLTSSGSFSQLGPVNNSGSFPTASGMNPGAGIILPVADFNFTFNNYQISGPSSFGSGIGVNATSNSGTATALFPTLLYLPSAYSLGTNISSTTTFANTTFSSLGLTPGTYEWSLVGTSEKIFVQIGPLASASVPAPLPLLGAGAAFATSRRLRSRIRLRPSAPQT